MPEMNFTQFHGAVPRCGHYEIAEHMDILYFIPEDMKSARRYDPFEDRDALLLDVARTGEQIAACEPFFDFLIEHRMLPLQETEFWLHGDFFLKYPKKGQPILDALSAFAERYGLPVWEAKSVAFSDYPARYGQRLMALRHSWDTEEDTKYLYEYELMKRLCQSKGSIPACTFALILLDLYLRFVEGTNGDFFIRNAEWMLHYGHEKTPELTAQVYDLVTCINLAHAALVSGEGKAVRQCKHCRQFFIAEDWRAEYCSPRCRGAYNSKMTRKRVKERKQRKQREDSKST